jgi:hypothetical protein
MKAYRYIVYDTGLQTVGILYPEKSCTCTLAVVGFLQSLQIRGVPVPVIHT